ncbi:hypothetical protein MNBD_PLANCTO02-1726 [hydrothermal vent metagenome]|uniref:LamG-like jellyroll fold domain-containing protein n=1 Tax=hydrothermal vent metagenome TaxID=652676 RepID=A0A3B1DKU9_9ZZZZ
MVKTAKKEMKSQSRSTPSETLLTMTLFTLSFIMLLGMFLDSVTLESDSKSGVRAVVAPDLPFVNLEQEDSVSRPSAIQTEQELFVWPSSRDTQFVGAGNVFLDNENRLQLKGGNLQAVNVESNLLGSCRSSNELSIELTVVPTNTNKESYQNIVAFRSEDSHNFLLGQTQKQFVFQLKTTANETPLQIKFGKIDPGKRHHLLISYREGTLICFLNGKGVLKSSAIKGKLENWQAGRLVLGGKQKNSDRWYGAFESLSIHGRTIDRTEAFDRYDLAMFQQKKLYQ